jgi:hypothetical protein
MNQKDFYRRVNGLQFPLNKLQLMGYLLWLFEICQSITQSKLIASTVIFALLASVVNISGFITSYIDPLDPGLLQISDASLFSYCYVCEIEMFKLPLLD